MTETKIEKPYKAIGPDTPEEESSWLSLSAGLGEVATQSTVGDIEHSSERLTEGLERFINDETTLEQIRKFPDAIRDSMVGASVKAFLLFKNGDSAKRYLEYVREVDDDRLISHGIPEAALIKTIAEMLGVDADTDGGKEAVYDYYQNNYTSYGYNYHGFNGVVGDKIKRDGLSVTNRDWDWKELWEIDAIGKRHGMNMLLGWGALNCEGTIFVSENSDYVYRYANASPEWFAQFVAEGFHVPVQGNNKKAYYYRDFKLAKQNVEDVCKKMVCSDYECSLVMSFFEKYWSKFISAGDSRPSLAIVSWPPYEIKTWAEHEEQELISGFSNLPFSLKSIHELDSDKRIYDDIPPEDISIVKLPGYDRIHPMA